MARPKEVVCKHHGPAPIALACRHVAAGVACGFHVGKDDVERPDAWCDRCNDELATVGEWTKELNRQADMTIVCTFCYDLAARRNRAPPEHARGRRALLTRDEHRRLCDRATTWVAEVQDAARAKWKFDTYARWDFDEEARALSFTDPEQATLVAEVRVVGAFSPKPGSFRWSWASYPDFNLLIAGISTLKMFGEVRGLGQLTTNDWTCTDVDGWQMTALAGYLLGCEGVYRAEFDDQFWFMLLGNWRHTRRGRTASDSSRVL